MDTFYIEYHNRQFASSSSFISNCLVKYSWFIFFLAILGPSMYRKKAVSCSYVHFLMKTIKRKVDLCLYFSFHLECTFNSKVLNCFICSLWNFSLFRVIFQLWTSWMYKIRWLFTPLDIYNVYHMCWISGTSVWRS